MSNQELIKAMKEVRKNPDIKCGICGNLYHRGFINQINNFVKKYIHLWPHFSGNNTFWIPSHCFWRTPDKQFDICHKTDSFWSGKQGELRRDALKFLIEKAELEDAQ